MPYVTAALLDQLRELLGPAAVVVAGETLEALSKDFYWYSPVLRRLLEDKRAEVVARPSTLDQLRQVVAACYTAGVPVVPRGAGTGNYGQCIPLYGGVVLDLGGLDKILEITPEGVLRCEAGARLGTIEPEVRKQGWELRCLPSTWVKSTLGGFFCGGSGGIGSITWGGIAAPGNVKAVTLLTCEAEPRLLRLEETDTTKALHTYGTTGIMVEIEMRLAPKVDYEQVVVSSPDWDALLDWTDALARNSAIGKRLVTGLEWPIPSFFRPILKHLRLEEHAAFLLVHRTDLEAVQALAASAGMNVAWHGPLSDPPRPPLLTDYTWNHTTLWAMKSDPQFTYLQAGYGPNFREQVRQLQARFPGEILFHFEWTAAKTVWQPERQRFVGDAIGVGSIPLVRFTTEERLQEIIAYCREIGVFIANPHTYKLEEGGRHPNLAEKRALKAQTDPKALLNPGKMDSHPHPFAAAS